MDRLVSVSARSCFLLLVALSVSLCSCAGITKQQFDTGPEFQGHYLASFEVSSFVPCGSAEKPGYGVGYWLEWGKNSGTYQKYEAEVSKGGGHPMVYLKFIGTISSPGGHGHLGAYAREVTVEEVLEVKRGGICQ